MEASFVMVASHKANADGSRAATWWFLLKVPRGRVGEECLSQSGIWNLRPHPGPGRQGSR